MPKIRPANKQQAETKPEAKPNRNLGKIAEKIRALLKQDGMSEKLSISRAIEKGRHLREAAEQCEPGEYMDWTAKEFPEVSHQTLINNRNVYDLCQSSPAISNSLKSGQLNLSLGALYLVASMKNLNQQHNRDTIIEEARRARVTRSKAQQIIELEERKLATEWRVPTPAAESMAVEASGPLADCDPVETEEETVERDTVTLLPDAEPLPDAQASPVKRLVEAVPEVESAIDAVEQDHLWPSAIKAVGQEKLRVICSRLQAALDNNCGTSAVKLAADRAEKPPTRKVH